VRVRHRLRPLRAGLTVGFKIYVVLKTGNERGGVPIYVTRPPL
jgi:hypothetical protein